MPSKYVKDMLRAVNRKKCSTEIRPRTFSFFPSQGEETTQRKTKFTLLYFPQLLIICVEYPLFRILKVQQSKKYTDNMYIKFCLSVVVQSCNKKLCIKLKTCSVNSMFIKGARYYKKSVPFALQQSDLFHIVIFVSKICSDFWEYIKVVLKHY